MREFTTHNIVAKLTSDVLLIINVQYKSLLITDPGQSHSQVQYIQNDLLNEQLTGFLRGKDMQFNDCTR